MTTTVDYSAVDSSSSNNEWADFWHSYIGVNVIPANSKEKIPIVAWKEFQDNPIPEEVHSQWKNDGLFDQGMAVIMGKVWHRKDMGDCFLVAIDCDNLKAIQELLTRNGTTVTPEQFAANTIVEQHLDNREKMHIYVYTNGKTLRDKTSDIGRLSEGVDPNAIPIFEVKASSKYLMYCCPSRHRDGHKYQILGTRTPLKLNNGAAEEWQEEIDAICRKYGLGIGDANNKIPIKDLFKEDTVIHEGHNRHEAMLRAMESLLRRNSGILSIQQIEELCEQWNIDHCSPPLSDAEFRKQMKSAMEFVQNNDNKASAGIPVQNKDGEAKEEQDQQNKITEILDIINERIRELFVDKHDTAFAAVQIGEHIETLPIKSSRFNRWICKLFYEELHRTIRAEQLKQITDLLESKALFDGGVVDLQLRVSKSGNSSYYYDLTNKTWQVVKITENGWGVVKSVDAPILFVRHKSQIAQVLPSREYSSDIFDRFMSLVNVKTEDSRILLKCYIISLFIPDIAKPILMLHGEQGAAKTMLEELIKSIVDPSSTPTLTFPRTIEELIQQLSHNYLPFYDNLSIIKDWTSDQLCRAVTGSGFSKRKLYSDDEDIIYTFRRGIAFSGVSLVASKTDLLDRGIIVELERIPEDKRQKEEDIKARLEVIKPELLGFIFDIISKVVQVQNNGGIKLDSRSRMADFEEYAEIISRILGHEPNEFIEAYRRNRELQTDVVIEGNPIAAAVIKLLEEPEYKEGWIGTATDLLKCLELYAERFKIDTKSKSYPKSAGSVSYRLNQVKTNLREIGINVSYTKDTKTRVRIWKLIKSVNDRSDRSIVQESENCAQNGLESANDVANDHSDTSKRSFAENGQNRAQNQENERSSDANDLIRTLDPPDNKPIMKLYGDTWGCEECTLSGDFWYMEEHNCNGRSKK